MPQPLDTRELRKGRGAYFTPPALAEFVANWAVRDSADLILEPSCGDAVFLSAAGYRLQSLGAANLPGQLQGHDIHRHSLDTAADTLAEQGMSANLVEGDFFDTAPDARFTAVIGNPPFIRFQGFTGQSRTKSLARALAAGVNLSGLASSWAAFTVHATNFLVSGGRLGLVLPAELLSVRYASPVREFLQNSFASIDLILFDELVFPGVQADVVVLMADGFKCGRTNHFTVHQSKNVSTLHLKVGRRWTPPSGNVRWTDALLDFDVEPLLAQIRESNVFTRLSDWGTVSSGTVTGANRYFALSQSEVASLGIANSDLQRLLPAGFPMGSMGNVTAKDIESADNSARSFLFYPQAPLDQAARSYIDHGVSLGIPERYKCRVRTPWWRVPLTSTPDLFVSYMSGATPRIVSNSARARHLNSIHGLRTPPETRSLAMKALPLLALNSYSLLSAELEGRSYGGGVLKLEPREASRWLVPGTDAASASIELYSSVFAMGIKLMKNGDLPGATEIADQIVEELLHETSAGRIDFDVIKAARSELLRRRLTRGNTPKSVAPTW